MQPRNPPHLQRVNPVRLDAGAGRRFPASRAPNGHTTNRLALEQREAAPEFLESIRGATDSFAPETDSFLTAVGR